MKAIGEIPWDFLITAFIVMLLWKRCLPPHFIMGGKKKSFNIRSGAFTHLLASFKELRVIQRVRNSEAALCLKYRCPDGIIKNFQFLVQQTGKLCVVEIVIGDGNKEERCLSCLLLKAWS